VGCLSSEETGSGGHVRTPVQIFGPIDTSRALHKTVKRDANVRPKSDSLTSVVRKIQTAPRFKARKDTVRASMVFKKKPASSLRIKIERPDNTSYTIQVGAFGNASNALRSQKKAKERFNDVPVFNFFVKSAKIYRVSIGKFPDHEAAGALLKTMQKKYPQDYQKCWINYILP
jgi:cell division septation protein DedD